MREIKFEYGFESVNGIVKKKYYLHEIPNIKEKCDVWNVLPIVYVRQFTGLKDKNGVEIYEGDLLVSIYGSHNPIELKFGEFLSGRGYTSIGFYWIEEDGEIVSFGKDLSKTTNYLKVIGNIHENPELLSL